MTIPAGDNYCPSCQEVCHDHPTICTVCGTRLCANPASSSSSTNYNNSSRVLPFSSSFGSTMVATAAGTSAAALAATAPRYTVVPEQLVEQIRENSRTLSELLRHVQTEIEATRIAQQDLLTSLRILRQEVQLGNATAAAAAAADIYTNNQRVAAAVDAVRGAFHPTTHPNLLASSYSRPTSKQTLQEIPRIVLKSNNSLFFYQAVLTFAPAVANDAPTSAATGGVAGENQQSDNQQRITTMEAVPGEFGDDVGKFCCCLDKAVVIVANPKTGKGNALSAETLAQIQQVRSSNPLDAGTSGLFSPSIIVYMERGDGVTFVQKALLAQNAGARAVVIGNNLSEPWPYVMQDSQQEARKFNLQIPVVMIKQQDARALLSMLPSADNNSNNWLSGVSLEISSQSHSNDTKECVICTDSFQVSQTAMRLPGCHHVFHESCAMQWLEQHNTCPYCRHELPTDDPVYEEERRRAQRTHAGSGTSTTTVNRSTWNTFYG